MKLRLIKREREKERLKDWIFMLHAFNHWIILIGILHSLSRRVLKNESNSRLIPLFYRNSPYNSHNSFAGMFFNPYQQFVSQAFTFETIKSHKYDPKISMNNYLFAYSLIVFRIFTQYFHPVQFNRYQIETSPNFHRSKQLIQTINWHAIKIAENNVNYIKEGKRSRPNTRMVTNSIQRVSIGYVHITFIRYALGTHLVTCPPTSQGYNKRRCKLYKWDARYGVYRLLEYRHNGSPWYNKREGGRMLVERRPLNFPPPFLAVRIFIASESVPKLCQRPLTRWGRLSTLPEVIGICRIFLLPFRRIWDI